MLGGIRSRSSAPASPIVASGASTISLHARASSTVWLRIGSGTNATVVAPLMPAMKVANSRHGPNSFRAGRMSNTIVDTPRPSALRTRDRTRWRAAGVTGPAIVTNRPLGWGGAGSAPRISGPSNPTHRARCHRRCVVPRGLVRPADMLAMSLTDTRIGTPVSASRLPTIIGPLGNAVKGEQPKPPAAARRGGTAGDPVGFQGSASRKASNITCFLSGSTPMAVPSP